MNYEQKAIAYCEQYGIVEYKITKNLLIYNLSYTACLNNPHYTIQHVINLDDIRHTSKRLKRYDPKGCYNRH